MLKMPYTDEERTMQNIKIVFIIIVILIVIFYLFKTIFMLV